MTPARDSDSGEVVAGLLLVGDVLVLDYGDVRVTGVAEGRSPDDVVIRLASGRTYTYGINDRVRIR